MADKYLSFDKFQRSEVYYIHNNKNECLGRLEKVRVGAWKSWCLFLLKDCYMSASCLDEVREKIRELNNLNKVNKKVNDNKR